MASNADLDDSGLQTKEPVLSFHLHQLKRTKLKPAGLNVSTCRGPALISPAD